MRPHLAIVLLLTVTAAGCVGQKRYRYIWDQRNCFGSGTDPVPGPANEGRDWPSLDCRHALYTVGFIELDEDGKLLDANQALKVRRLIEDRKKTAVGGKVITLVYVHGWKNNATQAHPGDKPKDVERFRSALGELGVRSRQADPAPPARITPRVPIIGVYIGWRGKSLMGPGWFTFLSYWGRRNAANDVGRGPDLAPILNDIIDTTNAGDTGSRVLLVGHSFGARVLEHAVATGKVELDDRKTAPPGTPLTPRVDLLLYVNSANDARLSLKTVLDLRSNPVTIRHPDYNERACTKPEELEPHEPKPAAAVCTAYPTGVAITSRGDLATKYLLPTANRINYDDEVAEVPSITGGPYLDDIPGEGRYKRSAAAHMTFLQSHDVREVPCPTRQQLDAEIAANKEIQAITDEQSRERAENIVRVRRAPGCQPGDLTCRFAFRSRGEKALCYETHQRQGSVQKRVFNNTSFWIMTVDKAVIDDHGDIWNRSFVEMLGELMAPRGFFAPGGKRFLIRTQARTP